MELMKTNERPLEILQMNMSWQTHSWPCIQIKCDRKNWKAPSVFKNIVIFMLYYENLAESKTVHKDHQ